MIHIRLKKKSFGRGLSYYIVLNHKTKHINKGFIEKLGFYTPFADRWQNKYVGLNYDRFLYWIARGAVINSSLFILLKGFFPTILKK